jgi:membrane-bound lytic murein transglycosylase D
MRVLRNMNPRYQADGWIPAGTTINATTRIAGLYNRYCVSGPRADLARALITADVNAAIIRPQANALHASVAVGDISNAQDAAPVVAPPAAAPARSTPRSHTVARGDTLSSIARRYACSVGQLARANNLRAPAYALRPGQKLSLEGCRAR